MKALRSDPHVASLELALSPDRMREFLAERVVPTVWPGRHLADLKRLYVAYKPGRRCLLSFKLWLEEERREPKYVTVTLGPLEKIRRIHRIHFDGRDEPAPGGAFILADLPCLVEVFPADWKMSSLSRAMALRELDPAPHLDDSRVVPVRDVSVVRYRAHRCGVLRYTLDDAGGVIGKVYAYAHRAENVRDKLEKLGPQARARGIAVPRFLGSGDTKALVLMELAPGDNLADLLESTGDPVRARELVRVAARTLTSFQSMDLESTRRRTVWAELDGLPDRAARIRLVTRELHGQIETLLGRLRGLVRALPPVPDTLVHGDFKPSQLLLHEENVSVVDLDRACLGDPAVDVGNFMAALIKEVLVSNRSIFDGLGEAFLEEVERERRDDRLLRASRLFAAVALVRMGIRKFERDPGSYARLGGEWPAGRLLAEAERQIVALQSPGSTRPARRSHG